jgi:hypothetical protein
LHPARIAPDARGNRLHRRVGDRIRFSMTNRSDEAAPGIRFTTAPMMHSMDFHSAMVSASEKYRSIAPGQTIGYEFTPNYPGVFMYHCGTPMVLEHIASGMYGMMIVEPREGYPTKVDREYAVVQSEFYTKPDPDKRKVDGVPLYVLDGARVRSKAPTYTVFNGRYNGFVDHPLEAKPGERVRLFLRNVGPSNTSSFHVVGTIFDRVWDHRVVVFAALDGPVDGARAAAAAKAAAGRMRGVEAATVRTADNPAAISFVLDPHKQAPATALQAVQKAAAVPGLRVTLLRVVD